MPITQYNSSVRQMSQSKFNSMKNANGKIPDLANQIVMTNSEDSNISCLRTEVVYDMTSSDASKNWGYPNGIGTGVTINKDFSKYDFLVCEYLSYNNSIVGFCDLSQPTVPSDTTGRYILYAVAYIGNAYSELIGVIDLNKSSLTTYLPGSGALAVKIAKIYGVLKTPSMIYTGDELIAGNGISIANSVISSSSNSTLLNATKYNITTDTRVPVSKATLQQYSYILIEIECFDEGGVNRISKSAGYFKVSDLVEWEYANDYNSMSFYSRKYAVLGTINFSVNTNDLMCGCEFAKPYEQTNLSATANDQIYIGNIRGIK